MGEMNFLEAVKAMQEGKNVKRKYWTRYPSYFYIDVNKINIYPARDDINKEEKLIADIRLKDIEATDWVVVEKQKVKLTEERIKACVD